MTSKIVQLFLLLFMKENRNDSICLESDFLLAIMPGINEESMIYSIYS